MNSEREIAYTIEQRYLEPGEPLEIFHKKGKPSQTKEILYSPICQEESEETFLFSNPCVFDEGDTCSALVQKQCLFCNFFQTKEQLEQSRKRVNARLSYLKSVRENRKLEKGESQ